MIKILRVRRISGSSANDILVGTYAPLMGIITTFSFSCLYCIFTMFKLFDLKIDTDRKRNKMNVPRGRISGWWMKMRTRSRSFLEWLVTESVCLFSSSIRQRLERGKESTENGLFFLRSGQGKSNRKRKKHKNRRDRLVNRWRRCSSSFTRYYALHGKKRTQKGILSTPCT